MAAHALLDGGAPGLGFCSLVSASPHQTTSEMHTTLHQHLTLQLLKHLCAPQDASVHECVRTSEHKPICSSHQGQERQDRHSFRLPPVLLAPSSRAIGIGHPRGTMSEMDPSRDPDWQHEVMQVRVASGHWTLVAVTPGREDVLDPDKQCPKHQS